MMERILVKELVNANFTNQSSKESFQFCCVDEDDGAFVPDENRELFIDMDIGSISFDLSAWGRHDSGTDSEDGYGELMDISSPVAWGNSKIVRNTGLSRIAKNSLGMDMKHGNGYLLNNCCHSGDTANTDSGNIDNIIDTDKINNYSEEFSKHCGYYDDDGDDDSGCGGGDHSDMGGSIPFAWERRHRGSCGGDEDFPDTCAPEIQEFEFSITFSKDGALGAISPADDLFYKGQLLPLHLPPRLQMVEDLSSSSKEQADDKGDQDVGSNMPKHVFVESEDDSIGSPLIARNPSFRVNIGCVDDSGSSPLIARRGCMDLETRRGNINLARQGSLRVEAQVGSRSYNTQFPLIERQRSVHIKSGSRIGDIQCPLIIANQESFPLLTRQPSFHVEPQPLSESDSETRHSTNEHHHQPQQPQKQKQEPQWDEEHEQLNNGTERSSRRWINGLLADCKDADVFPNCYKDPAALQFSESQASHYRIQSSSSASSSSSYSSKKSQDAASSMIWKVLLPDSRGTYNSSVLDIIPSPRRNEPQEKARWSCSFKLRVPLPFIRSLFAQKHNGNVLIHQCTTTPSTITTGDNNASENTRVADASIRLEYMEPSFRLTQVITEPQSTGCRENCLASKRKGKYYLDKYMKLFKSFYQVMFSTKKQHPRHHRNSRHLLDHCSADDCTPKVSSSSSSSLCPFSPSLSTSSSSSSSTSSSGSVCKVSQVEHKTLIYNEIVSAMESRTFCEKDAEKSALRQSNTEATSNLEQSVIAETEHFDIAKQGMASSLEQSMIAETEHFDIEKQGMASSLEQSTIAETEHFDIEKQGMLNEGDKLNSKFTMDESNYVLVKQSLALVKQGNNLKENVTNMKPSDVELFNERLAMDTDHSITEESNHSVDLRMVKEKYSSNSSLAYLDAEDSIQGAIAHCKRCSAQG